MTAMTDSRRDLLMRYFARIRSLEEERAKVSADIAEEWKALRASGFHVQAAREAYRRMYRLDEETRDGARLYEEALGQTPLEAHIESVTVRTGDGETVIRRPGAEAA